MLSDWIISAGPDDAVRRRQEAQDRADVEYRRTDDGLTDLFALGLSAPDAQTVLARIRAHAVPVGPADERSAGRRRVDALVDLVLGRDRLALDGERERHCPPGCGCVPGAPVPCGAQISVLVPLGAALGTTDELAELIGHGPLDPDLLAALLLAAPKLRAAWVDEHGVPVAVGDQVWTPERGDPASVREVLLRLANSPPGPPQPRHPDDHPPPGVHPPDTPGAYRVPRRLRRFLEIRRSLCEWPGCGVRAVRCDIDHDLAWPHGPTCACNTGPLCRRHHQIKQLGWTKQRLRDGTVRWISPTGRTWTSPTPHLPPATPVRARPALHGRADPLDELSPFVRERELWHQDPGSPQWDDPAGLELRTEDTDPSDETIDALAEQILHTDTRWTLDLDNPYHSADLSDR